MRNKCTAIWPKVIEARAPHGMCERQCGRIGCAAHHIILRVREKFRFEPLNGVWLCSDCHSMAHLDLIAFAENLDVARVTFNRRNRDDTSAAKRYASDYENIYWNLKYALGQLCE